MKSAGPACAHGAARTPGPQAARLRRSFKAGALALLLGLSVQGCGLTTISMGAGVPAGRPSAAASVETPAAVPISLPDPGVELRTAEDRTGIDVTHYDIQLDVTDPATGAFRGDVTLSLDLEAGRTSIDLDFAGLDIESVEVDGVTTSFLRDGAVLRIGPLAPPAMPQPMGAARSLDVRIRYGGAPIDGLFFGEDADLEPAVFADNWPNRARWWFPANDHPSDKASVRFTVRVPAGYGVIANGYRLDVREAGETSTHVWETDRSAPIPAYTMVVGIARFESRELAAAACGNAPVGAARGCADVSVWALPGDGDYGAEIFARAPDMVDFYSELIGPYPYEKLAHVESSTRFGGMENSSAIFYGRGAWEGRRLGEGVIAHETAHQWFGDAVTPASWFHLWVSEGFASYFGPLYFEARDGAEVFRERMEAIAETAKSSNVIGQAIVDSTSNNLFDLLNANSYQKGARVLHMLRGLLGDEVFFAGIRDYYARHLHDVADTEDVRAAFERVSGRDLEDFFTQWVYSPGYPDLAIAWSIEGDELVLDIRQRQAPSWPTFTMMAEIEVKRRGGTTFRLPIELAGRAQTLRFRGMEDVVDVAFDPDGWILKDVEVHRSSS